MLDLAFGLTTTCVGGALLVNLLLDLIFYVHRSRLGCQIKLTKALDGIQVALPSATRNMMVDKK
jgi:hypothetical protein